MSSQTKNTFKLKGFSEIKGLNESLFLVSEILVLPLTGGPKAKILTCLQLQRRDWVGGGLLCVKGSLTVNNFEE